MFSCKAQLISLLSHKPSLYLQIAKLSPLSSPSFCSPQKIDEFAHRYDEEVKKHHCNEKQTCHFWQLR
jgi:hypothetical protein